LTTPIKIGIDDGFAATKLALPDGRLIATPSRAEIGHAKVSWLNPGERRIVEYETEGTVYAVGEVDGAATRFDGYACSGMNRAIVQHALQCAGLEGQEVNAISGLPVSAFYRSSGRKRSSAINDKQQNLLQPVRPRTEAVPVEIVMHCVIPEALAAWYDYVIEDGDGRACLQTDRTRVPIAVVDIGGRTTDTVVVQDQGVLHRSSGSFNYGLLDVIEALGEAIQERFDLSPLSNRMLHQALRQKRVRLYGRDYDVRAEVMAAKHELVERLYAETRRQLGQGIELERILFVGGGTVALAEHLTDWFPNQLIVPEPAFANARGMLKYGQHVATDDVPD